MTYLLDTHALVWWVSGAVKLPASWRSVLRTVRADAPVWIADITRWEIATLVRHGKLALALPLRDWLDAATAEPLVRTLEITPAVAAEEAALPPSFHKDPADRLIVASARILGATLITRDERIRTAGVVPVI